MCTQEKRTQEEGEGGGGYFKGPTRKSRQFFQLELSPSGMYE